MPFPSYFFIYLSFNIYNTLIYPLQRYNPLSARVFADFHPLHIRYNPFFHPIQADVSKSWSNSFPVIDGIITFRDQRLWRRFYRHFHFPARVTVLYPAPIKEAGIIHAFRTTPLPLFLFFLRGLPIFLRIFNSFKSAL